MTSPMLAGAQRRVLAILMLWFCMALIDVGIVNVALPSIRQDLGASASDLQWILSGYTLTFGAVLAAAGRAGDIAGHGAVFILGLVVFSLASLAGALAPTPQWLNGARFIEGVGAGCMSPQVYGMVQRHFDGPARGRAFGLLGVAASLSVAIAPPLGGALIALGGAHWGWRLTFLVNVPLGLVGGVLAWRWFPQPLVHAPRGQLRSLRAWLTELDAWGSLLAALAVLCLLLPFVQFHAGASAAVWLWLPLSAGWVLAWVRWEQHLARRGQPAMIDLHLFAMPSFSNGLAIQTLYFLGMTSVWVLVALYAQEAAGFSALQTGLLSVPSAVLAAWAAHWSGRRVATLGRRLVIAGQGLALLGLALGALAIWAHAHAGASLWWIAAALALYGVGQGATVSPNQTLTLQAVPRAFSGSAGALVSTTQRVGASVGIAAVTGVSFAVLARADWTLAALAGFALMGALVLAALLVGWRDLCTARKAPG